MTALQAALKPQADAIGWRFAPGLGLTDALILMCAGGQPIAQAPLAPRDHELVRGYGRKLIEGRKFGPLSITLGLPDTLAGAVPMVERVPLAKRLLQYTDQFGRFHIELIAADGTVLGRATMTADEFAKFIGDGCGVLAIGKEGGLATQPHAGTA